MAAQCDFSLARFEDGVLVVNMQPPQAVGGWQLEFTLSHRPGGESGLAVKSAASGYGGGQSGITILDSGAGRFSVAITSRDTSGLAPKNYSTRTERLDSGSRTVLAQGTLTLLERG